MIFFFFLMIIPFSTVKALDGKLQVSTPRVGKVFNAPALPKASRKALGTVNRVAEKPMKTGKPLQPKQPTLTGKKVSAGYEHEYLYMCWHLRKVYSYFYSCIRSCR